jgi:hypothetical protein
METHTGGQQWDIPLGAKVVDVEGTGLGTVIETRPGLLVVEKGRLFPTDLYIPRAAISSFDGERVQIAVDREEVLAYRWDREPGTEPFGEDYIADPYVPAGAGAAGTGAPGYVENPDGATPPPAR